MSELLLAVQRARQLLDGLRQEGNRFAQGLQSGIFMDPHDVGSPGGGFVREVSGGDVAHARQRAA